MRGQPGAMGWYHSLHHPHLLLCPWPGRGGPQLVSVTPLLLGMLYQPTELPEEAPEGDDAMNFTGL